MGADRAFFVGKNGAYSSALWVTDGTAAGMRQLQVTGAWSSGLDPSNLTVSASGTLFFLAEDSADKPGLWVSDGTDAGTHELQVASAPAEGLFPLYIVPFGSGVAFNSDYDPTLWFSDGTAAGTHRLAVPGASSNGLYPAALTPFEGKLYFDGSDSAGKEGLWVTDGTAAGTQELQVPGANASGLAPRHMVSLGMKLLLTGMGTGFKQSLWVSDGTGSGTVPLAVSGLNPSGGYTGTPVGLFAFGAGKAAFVAADATGQEAVWVSDGTVAGTLELPGTHAGTGGAPMAALSDGKLAFIAADASGAKGVWVTDGTAAGTQELQVPGAAANLNPNGIVAVDNKLLFDGLDASGASRLWTSDGTSAGTSALPGTAALQAGYTSISAVVPGTNSGHFALTDTTTNAATGADGQAYTGPVSFLKWQLLWPGTDSVNLRANVGSAFLRGGSGTDALQATSGSNVLDGGTGSNFLVGASGADGGTDTFFVDARSSTPTWSTVTNFHVGDAVTIWGFLGGTSTLTWVASDGAAGYQGATIHSETGGVGTGVNGSMTFAGMSLADVQSKFTISTGSAGGNPYLYVKYTG